MFVYVCSGLIYLENKRVDRGGARRSEKAGRGNMGVEIVQPAKQIAESVLLQAKWGYFCGEVAQ